MGQRVRIVEKDNGSVSSTKNLIWAKLEICEERDASNNVTKRYYPQGMQVGSTNYYYTRDHLGSIREVADSSGAVQVRYDYDPFGRRTKVSGNMDADFGFTGHYYHQPSTLNLAVYRAYDADLGRWISRDPIEEIGGLNVYSYARNAPTYLVDPDGRNPLVVGGAAIGTIIEPGGGTIIGAGIGLILTVIGGAALWDWWHNHDSGKPPTFCPSRPGAGSGMPTKGPPNSSDSADDGKGGGTIRDYGPDGQATTDYDFGHDHTGAGDPHAHDWDWSGNKPVRRPPRPLRPGE